MGFAIYLGPFLTLGPQFLLVLLTPQATRGVVQGNCGFCRPSPRRSAEAMFRDRRSFDEVLLEEGLSTPPVVWTPLKTTQDDQS